MSCMASLIFSIRRSSMYLIMYSIGGNSLGREPVIFGSMAKLENYIVLEPINLGHIFFKF